MLSSVNISFIGVLNVLSISLPPFVIIFVSLFKANPISPLDEAIFETDTIYSFEPIYSTFETVAPLFPLPVTTKSFISTP